MIEQLGHRIFLLVIGPPDKIPALYARGRWRFATTRGAAYACVISLGLLLANAVGGGPILRPPIDFRLLFLRLSGFWAVQFMVGAILAVFVWRLVERLALMQQSPAAHADPSRASPTASPR